MIRPNRVPGQQFAAPVPYQSANAPTLAFGSGGTLFQSLGQGLASVAGAVNQWALEDDRTRVQEAQNALADWSRQRLFGEEGGYLQSTGKDAVTGEKTLAADYDQTILDLSESLDNNRQKSQFAALANQTRQQSMDQAARHAARQRILWQDQTSEAALVEARQSAAASPENPRLFGEGLIRTERETRAIAARAGLDDKAGEDAINQNIRAYIKETSLAAAAKDPMLALSIFEQNRSFFTPEQDQEISGEIAALWTRQQAATFVEAGDLDGLRRLGDDLHKDGAAPLAFIARGELNKAEAEFAATRSRIEGPAADMADDLCFGRSVDPEKLAEFRQTANKIGASDLAARLDEGVTINQEVAVFKRMPLSDMQTKLDADQQAGAGGTALFAAQKKTFDAVTSQSHSDPLGAAMEQGIIPTAALGASSEAEEWADRIASTYAVCNAYGAEVPVLRPSEAEAIKRQMPDMDASAKMGMLSQIDQATAGRADAYWSVMDQLTDALPEFSTAGRIMTRDPKAAETILKGLDVLKDHNASDHESWAQELERALPSHIIEAVPPSAQDRSKASILAYYQGRAADEQNARGNSPSDFVRRGWLKDAVDVVTNGPIEMWPGYTILAAWPGQTAAEARSVIAMVTDDDLKGVAVPDRPSAPDLKAEGGLLSKQQFLESELKAIGNGQYYVMAANGMPAVCCVKGEWRPWVFDMNLYRDRLKK